MDALRGINTSPVRPQVFHVNQMPQGTEGGDKEKSLGKKIKERYHAEMSTNFPSKNFDIGDMAMGGLFGGFQGLMLSSFFGSMFPVNWGFVIGGTALGVIAGNLFTRFVANRGKH